MHVSRSVGGIVNAEAQVERAQGVACNVVYLALQEGAEGAVHRESACVAVGKIHSRGKHRHGELAPLFHAHCLQFVVQRHILRRIERELQSHIIERLGDEYSTLEEHRPSGLSVAANGGLGLLGCRDV